ncbi:MAG: hypothetical protein ACUVSX_05455 [Aggregatilineales bacterium]
MARLALYVCLLLILLLVPLTVETEAQDAVSDTLTLAQAAAARFAAGEYASAAQLYKLLIESGAHDAAVFYNAGAAYAMAGDLGHAMLHYRAAQARSPRDAELAGLIAQLRAQRVDLLGEEVTLTDGLATATAQLMTYRELQWATWILWLILWTSLATVGAGGERWRSPLRTITIAALVGLMLFGGLLINQAYVEANRPAAVVIAAAAPVYSGPGETYLEIYRMHAAAEIRVLETRGEWARFIRPDARQGWIKQSALALVNSL